jgi:hypothetical protein
MTVKLKKKSKDFGRSIHYCVYSNSWSGKNSIAKAVHNKHTNTVTLKARKYFDSYDHYIVGDYPPREAIKLGKALKKAGRRAAIRRFFAL